MNQTSAMDTESGTDRTLYRQIAVVVLIVGSLYFAFQSLLSLQWHAAHDSGYLHSILYLIERYDLVPYKDIFEPSLPLTYMFHQAIGKLVGFGESAFRIVDVVFLSALLFVTWRIMRPLGPFVAWAAILSFGLLYQSFGSHMTLQRDYLGLLLVSTAIWVASDVAQFGRRRWRYVVIGVLFGLSAAIKPHYPIGLLPVMLYALRVDERALRRDGALNWRVLAPTGLLVGLGLTLAIALPIFWLWQMKALSAFGEIAINYLPLYRQLNGNQEILGLGDHLIYIINTAPLLGGKAGIMMAAALGSYFGLVETRLDRHQRRLVILLTIMMPVYIAYELIAAKFWTYHWMPFFYFASCCSALVLLPVQDRYSPRGRRLFALVAFVVGLGLTLRPAPETYRQISGQPPAPIAGGRTDRMTAFLQAELRPGDTVQPLDGVTGGSAAALRQADAELATPYIVDYQFYHHVSTDYIQGLRRDFIARMEAAPPRFILDVPSPTRPHGLDTTTEFLELDGFIAAGYHVALEDVDFTIYERNEAALPAVP